MVDLPDPERLGPAADHAWSGAGAEHRVVRWRGGLVLIEIAAAAPLPPGAALLRVEGQPIAPPTGCVALGDPAAPRLLFAARDPDGRLATGARCDFARGGVPLAAFILDPAAPAAALLLERPAEERAALLRFLAFTMGPLLGAAAGDLAGACHALAASLPATIVARPLCRPGATLSLWAVPEAPSGAWRLVEPCGLRRLGAAAAGVLVIPAPAPAPGALLLPPGDTAPLRLGTPQATLPRAGEVLARAMRGRPGAPLIRALAEPRWHPALREAQLRAPAAPHRETDPRAPLGGALELALADGAGGLFLSGWLRDPLAMVAGLELESAFGRRALPPAALHRVARPDLAPSHAKAAHGAAGPSPGFLVHLPDADHPAVAQWRLRMRLHSGEAITLIAPPSRLAPAAARDQVLRAAHPRGLDPAVLAGCIAPAAWRLQRAAMALPGTPETIRLGPAPRRPRVALIVPLWRNLGFLRAQFAAFARDAALRSETEILYVLDSPEQRAEVEHLLRGMAALHGLGVGLVVMPSNRGYAAACNAGAAASAAPVLGFINSDVLPAAPGWLAPLLARLGRDRRLAAIGPKLLFEDGAIQHAGLLFRRGLDGQWLNDHYYKGHARGFAPACRARRVPGVTGAALFLRRAGFEAAGGFSTDYIIGDFEDSDLCLALREAGGEIGYEPAAELFHFERQSIAGHAGHAKSLAGACNRLLHHRRWDAAIAALMPRFPELA
jgi:GT2 family glycosyltransferase